MSKSCKLCNNEKMIISKYLPSYTFKTFVNAFNLKNMYFTSYNYITINGIQKYNFECIKYKIDKLISEFPNLKEIIINVNLLISSINLESKIIFNLFKLYNKLNIEFNIQKLKFKFKFNYEKISISYYYFNSVSNKDIEFFNELLKIIKISETTNFYLFINDVAWNNIKIGRLKILENCPKNLNLVYNIMLRSNFNFDNIPIDVDNKLLYSSFSCFNKGFINGCKYEPLNVFYNYDDFKKYICVVDNKIHHICIKNENFKNENLNNKINNENLNNEININLNLNEDIIIN